MEQLTAYIEALVVKVQEVMDWLTGMSEAMIWVREQWITGEITAGNMANMLYNAAGMADQLGIDLAQFLQNMETVLK